MNDIAVVKPDHIGDFILSIPALNALYNCYGPYDLFLNPNNFFISSFFLGGKVNSIPFSMNQFIKKSEDKKTLINSVKIFSNYNKIIYLRDDDFINGYLSQGRSYYHCNGGKFDHETNIQRNSLVSCIGSYSRSSYFPFKSKGWPSKILTVGLCVSAGFSTNALPISFFNDLYCHISEELAIKVVLIGGPNEFGKINTLLQLTGIQSDDVVIGDRDISRFLGLVEQCDVVIGGDSGTMHLVSTVTNTLSLFTSSPWWRFAPFGSGNRLLYYDIACRPCIQFMSTAVNSCVTRECLSVIDVNAVLSALLSPDIDSCQSFSGIKFVSGASHL